MSILYFSLFILFFGLPSCLSGPVAKRNVYSKVHELNYELLNADKQLPFNIIGGSPTSIKKHPHQVAIIYNGTFQGAGIVIDSKWVVTLATILISSDPKDIIVSAGNSNYRKGKKFSVDQTVVHPNFDSSTLNNDIALIRLQKKITSKSVKTISIGDSRLNDSTKVILSGWGSTNVSQVSSPKLYQATLNTVNDDNCKSSYSGYTISSSMVCAASKISSPCWFDFGDVITANKKAYGLFSWSKGCDINKYPGIYTDLVSLQPWIKSVIKSQDQDGFPGSFSLSERNNEATTNNENRVDENQPSVQIHVANIWELLQKINSGENPSHEISKRSTRPLWNSQTIEKSKLIDALNFVKLLGGEGEQQRRTENYENDKHYRVIDLIKIGKGVVPDTEDKTKEKYDNKMENEEDENYEKSHESKETGRQQKDETQVKYSMSKEDDHAYERDKIEENNPKTISINKEMTAPNKQDDNDKLLNMLNLIQMVKQFSQNSKQDTREEKFPEKTGETGENTIDKQTIESGEDNKFKLANVMKIIQRFSQNSKLQIGKEKDNEKNENKGVENKSGEIVKEKDNNNPFNLVNVMKVVKEFVINKHGKEEEKYDVKVNQESVETKNNDSDETKTKEIDGEKINLLADNQPSLNEHVSNNNDEVREPTDQLEVMKTHPSREKDEKNNKLFKILDLMTIIKELAGNIEEIEVKDNAVKFQGRIDMEDDKTSKSQSPEEQENDETEAKHSVNKREANYFRGSNKNDEIEDAIEEEEEIEARAAEVELQQERAEDEAEIEAEDTIANEKLQYNRNYDSKSEETENKAELLLSEDQNSTFNDDSEEELVEREILNEEEQEAKENQELLSGEEEVPDPFE